MYNTATATKMINAIIPISRFNKGEAGKIIDEVKAEGAKVIVKNNNPECVIISVCDYDNLVEEAQKPKQIIQTPEEIAKRKAFIAKIRENVTPPIPAEISIKDRKAFMDSIGPIDVDEESIIRLREMSYPRGEW